MRMMVRSPGISDDDLKLQIEAYSRKMLMYPVDDVLVALERWPDEHEFWPAWAELKQAMDSRMADRAAQERPRLERPLLPHEREAAERARLRAAMTPEQKRAEIEEALALLRDPNQPFIARATMIKLGETMLARMG